MRADFFVHPDFYRIDRIEVTPQIEVYEDYLREAVEGCDFPVLVRSIREKANGIDTSFLGFFEDPACHFETGQMYRDSRASDGGTITTPSAYKAFGEFIDNNGITEGIVHGSYLGQCTKGFALQLYGILNGLDIFAPGQVRGDSSILINELMLSGDFSHGAVGLGYVLHHPSYDTRELYRHLTSSIVGKSVVAQFFRPETMVFEMGLPS